MIRRLQPLKRLPRCQLLQYRWSHTAAAGTNHLYCGAIVHVKRTEPKNAWSSVLQRASIIQFHPATYEVKFVSDGVREKVIAADVLTDEEFTQLMKTVVNRGSEVWIPAHGSANDQNGKAREEKEKERDEQISKNRRRNWLVCSAVVIGASFIATSPEIASVIQSRKDGKPKPKDTQSSKTELLRDMIFSYNWSSTPYEKQRSTVEALIQLGADPWYETDRFGHSVARDLFIGGKFPELVMLEELVSSNGSGMYFNELYSKKDAAFESAVHHHFDWAVRNNMSSNIEWMKKHGLAVLSPRMIVDTLLSSNGPSINVIERARNHNLPMPSNALDLLFSNEYAYFVGLGELEKVLNRIIDDGCEVAPAHVKAINSKETPMCQYYFKWCCNDAARQSWPAFRQRCIDKMLSAMTVAEENKKKAERQKIKDEMNLNAETRLAEMVARRAERGRKNVFPPPDAAVAATDTAAKQSKRPQTLCEHCRRS